MRYAGTPPFVYHALHKTASTKTRAALKVLCKAEGLRCLTYEHCGVKSPVTCAQRLAKAENGSEALVDYGSLTPSRLLHQDFSCCRPLRRDLANGTLQLDGIVEHFPLNAEGAMEFLDQHLPKSARRFTIVREPTEQFLSYLSMMRAPKNNYQQTFLDEPRGAVQQLLRYANCTKHPGGEEASCETIQGRGGKPVSTLFHFMTNSQAKELGWDGVSEASLETTLAYVERLDFVGLYEDLPDTFRALTDVLGIPQGPFRSLFREQSRRSRGEGIGEGLRAQIAQLQWADRKFSTRARTQLCGASLRVPKAVRSGAAEVEGDEAALAGQRGGAASQRAPGSKDSASIPAFYIRPGNYWTKVLNRVRREAEKGTESGWSGGGWRPCASDAPGPGQRSAPRLPHHGPRPRPPPPLRTKQASSAMSTSEPSFFYGFRHPPHSTVC